MLYILYIIFSIFSLLLVFICFLYLLNIFFTKIPFVPISKNTNKEIIRLINENKLLENKKVFYDLGSGDGRLLFTLSKIYKDINFVGYEIGPFPFLYSKFINLFLKRKNVNIIYGNFFKKDLKDADFIFCYLSTDCLEKLKYKFKKELRDNALIMTCDFRFSDLEKLKEFDLKDKNFGINKKIFIYSIK